MGEANYGRETPILSLTGEPHESRDAERWRHGGDAHVVPRHVRVCWHRHPKLQHPRGDLKDAKPGRGAKGGAHDEHWSERAASDQPNAAAHKKPGREPAHW